MLGEEAVAYGRSKERRAGLAPTLFAKPAPRIGRISGAGSAKVAGILSRDPASGLAAPMEHMLLSDIWLHQ